jgi:GNAT superfamily N-acetyltransferase
LSLRVEPIQDRSPETLTTTLTFVGKPDCERFLILLQKAPNPCWIVERDSPIGFLNWKPEKNTIYLPIFFGNAPQPRQIEELAREIDRLLASVPHRYRNIFLRKPLPGVLGELIHHVDLEAAMVDYRRPGGGQRYSLADDDFRWTEERPDIEELILLYQSCFAYEGEYVGQAWDNLIPAFFEKPHRVVSCYSEQTLIGNITESINANDDYVYGICTRIEYQHKGIGAGLLRRALNQSKNLETRLSVYTNNPNAIRLYEAHGFQRGAYTTIVGRNPEAAW